MSVIDHDFGLPQRRIARRFTRLLNLNALHEANVRANPIPYLERASERIYQLEKALFEAAQASAAADDAPASDETILVNKAEYQRLLDCRAIIEKALAQLGPEEEDLPAPGNP
jgi:hypothetical protein